MTVALKDLSNPDYFDNREVSWLSFNRRVIQEAIDKTNPLLERFNFISIGSSNLDEFMMVRVAGLQDQKRFAPNAKDTKKQWTADQQLQAIADKNKDIVSQQYLYLKDLVHEAKKEKIFFRSFVDLNEKETEEIRHYFSANVYPVLTPLGIDAYRPFPRLNNKVTNVFVNLKKDEEEKIAIVPIPPLVRRYYHFKEEEADIFVDLYDIVRRYIGALFSGYEVVSSFCFRVTRNADLNLNEEGAEDLLIVMEDFLRRRKNGSVVRLEVDTRQTNTLTLDKDIAFLEHELEIEDRDIYRLDGPLDLTGLKQMIDELEKTRPELLYQPFYGYFPSELNNHSIFDYIDKEDKIFFHPYDSFRPIVRFIKEASEDPNTIAIKQTLYRVSNNSPIVAALKKGAENGIQVTVLVELKARFDEENNVEWAKQLEDAGCQVIYGINNLKTHSKIAMVVRQTPDGLRRYVHLGTGNYNDKTARHYTDMGVLTTDEYIGEDATNFFNYLSGYSDIPDYHYLRVSPYNIRDDYIRMIDKEIKLHKKYGNGHIIAKMNSLTSKDVIKKYYEASQAGVKVDLIVRGICCLIPGIPGVSENIRVSSIVGRFLEHSRIYYFYNNGDCQVFLSSADMMTRNLIHRVEIEFPILQDKLKERVLEVLKVYLSDNAKAYYKNADGHYLRKELSKEDEKISSQRLFVKYAKMRSENKRKKRARAKGWWQRFSRKIDKEN